MPYIDDILAETGDAVFDPAKDVSELHGDEQPGGGDAFALEAGEATLVYRFNWLKARSFVRFMLGFSFADRTKPYRLRRENPQPHPRYGYLTAASVHFSSHAPSSGGDDAVPARAPNFPAVYGDIDLTKTGKYLETWATVKFVDRPWNFRPDGFVTTYSDELFRNCYWDHQPNIEMLSAEGPLAQLKFSATGDGGPSTTPPTPIPSPFGTLLTKTTFFLNWMWVPESYLSSDPNLFDPVRIRERVGFVNDRKFGKWGTGTVQMMPPQMTRFRFPVATFDGLFPFYGWNIRIPFVHFQPRPRGESNAAFADDILAGQKAAYAAAVAGGDAAAIAAAKAELALDQTKAEAQSDGYRLMPWAANRKWYPAVRSDGASYLFQEANLNTIFQHIDDFS